MTEKIEVKSLGLFEAFALAQAEMTNAPLNKVNPHFKSKYADLAAIRDAVIPALSKYGIACYQTIVKDESGDHCAVTTLAKGDQKIESHTPILDKTNQPQKFGSAMTYARRYGLAAICGISAEEDDDGNAAQGGQKQQVKRKTETPIRKEFVVEQELTDSGTVDWEAFEAQIMLRVNAQGAVKDVNEILKANVAAITQCGVDCPEVENRIKQAVVAKREELGNKK